MSQSWSEKIAAKYGLSLTEDLCAWWDDEVWRREGGAEFNLPLSPEQILDPDEGVIWAGFMPPDLLPVIGNSYGDWLCLKIGLKGEIVEVVYWCHGGGDWIPYGRTLPEALIYDVAQRLSDPRREQFSPTSAVSQQTFEFAQWACSRLALLGIPGMEIWKSSRSKSVEPLTTLLNSGVAEIAVRRDLCLRRLQSPLKDKSDAWIAKELDIQWDPDYVSCLFDTALISPPNWKRSAGDFRWSRRN